MNCKSGDLAIIKRAVRMSNVGKIVKVLHSLGQINAGSEFVWNSEIWYAPVTDQYWVIEHQSIDTIFGPSREAYIADSWLTPIKPELNDDEVSTNTTLEVTT